MSVERSAVRGLKTFEKTETHFSGEYKGWSIEINKEEELEDHWYIMVTGDKGTAYDGYFEEYHNDIDAVILQALKGSQLI